MYCPKCNDLLTDHILEGKLYHRCSKCNGLWFDKGELAQIMKEKNWFKIDSNNRNIEINTNQGKLLCPRDKELLHTVEYGSDTGIKVEVCSKCEGLWLDAGEIQSIHKISETKIEKIKNIIEDDLTAIELFMIKIGPYLPK